MSMEFHRGRLIDHVQLFVSNLEASRRFYEAVLRSLGRELVQLAPGLLYSDELVLSPANGTPSRIHLAFQADDREHVQRVYEAGLSAGGRDNGKPGERKNYHPGYYAAYLLDPDGNNIEAVHHGPGKRSAASVVITA
jgi:catechol 2,3-dioxygenase-like lactoylglutathione lyase family enzyme